MIIEENETLQTVTEIVAPNIIINWDPVRNDGLVTFNCERTVTQQGGEVPQLLERGYFGVMSDSISAIVARNYEIPNLTQPGQTLVVPGWMLMMGIKAAFDRVYVERTTQDLPTPEEPDNVDPESPPVPADT